MGDPHRRHANESHHPQFSRECSLVDAAYIITRQSGNVPSKRPVALKVYWSMPGEPSNHCFCWLAPPAMHLAGLALGCFLARAPSRPPKTARGLGECEQRSRDALRERVDQSGRARKNAASSIVSACGAHTRSLSRCLVHVLRFVRGLALTHLERRLLEVPFLLHTLFPCTMNALWRAARLGFVQESVPSVPYI